jgi:PAS domain S-box-containing protein
VLEHRILLLALRGRDALVLNDLLTKKGHECISCSSAADLANNLQQGAGAVLITEESLIDSNEKTLSSWCGAQPPWSDLPFVLLATKRVGKRPVSAMRALNYLGNVVVLERPIHGETLVSAIRAALRVRRRQYVARQHLEELKAAEDRLIELNGLLEARISYSTAEREMLWTLSEDMLARADYQGGLRAISPAWCRVLGFTEQDLVTRPYSDIIHPDDLPTVISALNSMRASGQPTRFENRIMAADGSWKPIGWTVSPEEDGIHFIAIGRDLSHEKAREQELVDSQDQLRQAQKMEAVGQLTGGIAHDFNNLLQGISGSLELLKLRVAQGRIGDLDRFIEGAVTSANRAAALTHRLLAFSRRQPLDPKSVEANPLVLSMEELFHRTMGENISVELTLEKDLWPTLCDPNQLENALLNLAINARDAMPDGGHLTIQTMNTEIRETVEGENEVHGSRQYVCITVTDTGTGMHADVIERAFDPFFTTKTIGQGTGLGLSMIYGFAQQSEGFAKISSELGEGTTVTLCLPRYLGGPAQHANVEISLNQRTSGHGEVVLVIDDEPVVRGLIVEVLHELGYRAMEAADGVTGLAMLKCTDRIDLLVTDIGLPGLDGRQVADFARCERPDLKILFMTGYAEKAASAQGFMDAGMSMMTKPFALDSFAARVRDIVHPMPIANSDVLRKP